MTDTLYYSPGACSLAPHIVLEEIGQPYRMELRSTDRGETHTPEFHRINPKGRVPVLEREGFVLTEAPAILMFLASQRPDLMLLPDVEEGRARLVEWFNWLSGTVHATAVRMIWRPEHFISDTAQHPGIVARGHEHLTSAFKQIEAQLCQAEWAVGNRYSVVDPYLLVFYRWAIAWGSGWPTRTHPGPDKHAACWNVRLCSAHWSRKVSRSGNSRSRSAVSPASC